MAAALGELLVFEVEACGAGAGVFDDGLADHLGFAKAGVGVGEDGEVAGVGGFADAAGEVLEGEQAHVRDARGDGSRCAGDVAGFKAVAGDGAGGEGVEGTGNRDAAAVHGGAETGWDWGFGGHGGG